MTYTNGRLSIGNPVTVEIVRPMNDLEIQLVSMARKEHDMMGRPKADPVVIAKFSETLNVAIAKKNITQREIAQILGIKQSAVSNWCIARNMPNRRNLYRLAEILEIPVSQLQVNI